MPIYLCVCRGRFHYSYACASVLVVLKRELKERLPYLLICPFRNGLVPRYMSNSLHLAGNNLVPSAFPLMVGGAGKGPGVNWPRVHLTP